MNGAAGSEQPLLHFTYCETARDGDLQQGDVLRRTPELEGVIEQYHPYYLKNDYTHFLILTQSCDLVRRSTIAAPYITLAAVRPLSFVIKREAERYQSNWVVKKADAVGKKYTDRLLMYLAKILNNNESEYFYLHEDRAVGFPDSSCAFLRLSIALKPEHYEVCRSARLVSMHQTFQSKLGWNIGNIYARVGTDDWVPRKIKNKDEWDDLLRKLLAQHVYFVEDRKVEYTRKNNAEADAAANTREEVRQIILAAPEWKKKDDVIEAAIKQLVEARIIGAAQADEARRLLQNNASLRSYLG